MRLLGLDPGLRVTGWGVIDVDGNAIPRLYAAGEMGSSFGHLYLAGGNIAECFVTGRIAGTEAAGLAALG